MPHEDIVMLTTCEASWLEGIMLSEAQPPAVGLDTPDQTLLKESEHLTNSPVKLVQVWD